MKNRKKTISNKIIKVFILTLFSSMLISSGYAQSDEEQVKEMLKKYHDAIEALDATGTGLLFAENSSVFESGGVEGTYSHYLEHHLGPELKVFKSFAFNDYKVDVHVDLPYAFTTETYMYKIVLAEDDREIEQKGVATSILKKIDGTWKIIKLHSSARRVKKE